jgi:integrase
VRRAGRGEGGHLVGLAKPWATLCKAADLPGLRIHDLRHSYASIGAAGGDGLFVVGKLLGHKDAKTTARYAHLAADPMKEAADRIANRIAAAMAGTEAEVVGIKENYR